uniref:Protein kinase domain-containing protein n=1 Tax=Periophthalmus magnuspinnatus TaxID=409849 RepID=A0A3B4B7F0_9GOBI
ESNAPRPDVNHTKIFENCCLFIDSETLLIVAAFYHWINVNYNFMLFCSEEYENQRCFSSHPLHKLFSNLLISLVKNRLCRYPPKFLTVLTCLRILVRDMELQVNNSKQIILGQYSMRNYVAVTKQKIRYIHSSTYLVLILAYMFLYSPECREQIGELHIVENLLVILQEYDLLSKRMCAELLRLLCSEQCVLGQLCALRGVPVLLSLLHSHHLKLLWSLCWVLVQMCQEPEARVEIRSWGGVQQLLHLLSCDRQYVWDRSSIETLSSANASGRLHKQHMTEELSQQEQRDNIAALQAACCTALTELSLDDSCAHHIVQENGVFIIAKFILPQTYGADGVLQCYAFRALRFLFSVERNRHVFKRLFPTDLFELFIDVGHYVRDLTAYETLQVKLESLRDSIMAVDQSRPPLRVISGYSILDHLGTGAFGSVFKVRKQGSQTLLALKEVNLHNPAFGKDKKSRDSNVDKIISELSIIREQMAHPNIVKYYKTFLEGERLYIVMELIEGVPLAEHLSSLKEKNQNFTEDRVWNIFIQMCLALRYLHRDKHIVHRDLSPNNIMLGDQDWVTITDFGLAKQKQENSKLTSVVGTILYSCPEVVKSEPYGEKADVWALGCVLYQMATLQPPFYSSNMLSLANKVQYQYTLLLLLSPSPDQRPDIVQVSSSISELLMRAMDRFHTSYNALERRAQRDRKRVHQYFLERNQANVPSAPTQVRIYMNSLCAPGGEGSEEEEELLDLKNNGPNGEMCGQYFYVLPLPLFHPPVSLSFSLPYSFSLFCPLPVSPSSSTLTSSVCLSFLLSFSLSLFLPSLPFSLPLPPSLFPLTCMFGLLFVGSVSAALCVSQSRVRQIDDPSNRLLLQLHKVLFITQLPPAPHHDSKRHLVERFKKSLFNVHSDPYNLKVELSKVFIEELLEENGYYKSTR